MLLSSRPLFKSVALSFLGAPKMKRGRSAGTKPPFTASSTADQARLPRCERQERKGREGTLFIFRVEEEGLGFGAPDAVPEGLVALVEVEEGGDEADFGEAQPRPHELGAVGHEDGHAVAFAEAQTEGPAPRGEEVPHLSSPRSWNNKERQDEVTWLASSLRPWKV